MSLLNNYVGCHVYIYDEAGNAVANTVICDYIRPTMTIFIRQTPRAENIAGFATLLILTDGEVHEYRGKLRRSSTDPMYTEIALSGGKSNEKRGAKRYPVNATGLVLALIINEHTAAMLNPIKVTITNLSTSGALIRALPNTFIPHCRMEIQLNVGSSSTPLRGEIVWINGIDPFTCEYGCKFI